MTFFTSLDSRRLFRGTGRKSLYALAGVALCELVSRFATARPDAGVLRAYFERGKVGGLLRIYDLLAGGGISRGTVAALGIMPYLSARTFIWLAGKASPAVEASWQSEEGRRRLTVWIRVLTLVLSLIQSFGYARFLESIPGAVERPGTAFVVQTVLVQTLVALFVLWMAEQVTAPTDVEMQMRSESQELATRV